MLATAEMTAPTLLHLLRTRGVKLSLNAEGKIEKAKGSTLNAEEKRLCAFHRETLKRLLSPYPPILCCVCGQERESSEVVWLAGLYHCMETCLPDSYQIAIEANGSKRVVRK